MSKYIFIGIGAFLLFLLSLLTPEGTQITHNMPSAMKPGEQVVAEFLIKKADAIQFAKLQIELPQGISAEEMDSKSGAFSLNASTLKIIWMQFPSENEVVVKVKLKADQNSSGLKIISGKLQYVSGNEKMNSDFPPHEITIASEKNDITNSSNSETKAGNSDSTNLKPDEPGAKVSVIRTLVKDGSSGSFKAEIKINKENIKGFAKYSEEIPEGLTVIKGGGSSGASFKFVEGKVSIIWATLPKEEKITAFFILKPQKEFLQNPVLQGSFSYLENEQAMKLRAENIELPLVKKEVVVAIENQDVDSQKITKITKEEKTGKEEGVKEKELNEEKKEVDKIVVNEEKNKIPEEEKTIENKKQETVVDAKQEQQEDKISKIASENKVAADKNVAKVPDVSLAGLNFHVQIGAYKSPPTTSFFTSVYGITDKIFTDMHEGLTKFMTGKFSEYKASRDYREEVKGKGIQGAFITAYNSGKRITVQEALMLMNQKWYK